MELLPKNICSAMAKAFADISGAPRTKENSHLRYKYADLQSIIEAIKPHISKHGLWFYQTVHTVEGHAAIETVIVHESGENLSCGIIKIPILKNDPQGYGSALTYARKYSLSAAFGVAQDDDDGEAACGHTDTKKPVPKASKKVLAIDTDSTVTKEELIHQIKSMSNMFYPEFDAYLSYLEARCEGKSPTFIEVLAISVEDPSRLFKGYQDWKKRTQNKVAVES